MSISGKFCECSDLGKKDGNGGKPLTDVFPFHFAEIFAGRCQHLDCCRKNHDACSRSNGFAAEFCGSQEQRNLGKQHTNADKTFRKLVPVQFSKLLANRSKNLDCGCKDHHLSSTLDNSFTVGTHSFGRGNHHSGQTRNTNEAGGKLFCVQIGDLFKRTRQNKHRRSNTEHSRYTLHHTSYLTTDLVKHCHRSEKIGKQHSDCSKSHIQLFAVYKTECN